MEKLLKNKLIIILILTLGLFVRFYLLADVPASMNRDEPAIGYNAYSILKTSRDEWGYRFPLIFKSFGDYKSPFYIYLTIVPIIIFGLNEFSVRFLGTLAGFILIFIVYLIIKNIIKKDNKTAALSGAFIMVVGSWQIFYSRFSFEANLALLLNALILYMFAKEKFRKVNIGILVLIPLT